MSRFRWIGQVFRIFVPIRSGWQGSELLQRLLQALVELPRQQAEAFCLRYLAELEYREIAETLEINPNSVGAPLHRARESLRQMLSHFVAPEE